MANYLEKQNKTLAPTELDMSFLNGLDFGTEPIKPQASLDEMMQQALTPAILSGPKLNIGAGITSSKVINLSSRKRETYQVPIDDVKEAMDSLSKNMTKFEFLARTIQNQAIALAAACAPGDGHGGIQNNSSSLNSNGEISLSSNITSIFGKKEHNHKSGEIAHCQHNNDYGDCSEGCKKAA